MGAAGDRPVPGQYNGDGIVDVAMFRPSTGVWSIGGVGVYRATTGRCVLQPIRR